jgi:putative hydroxymethylpyrimidine transport system substrate-binding protein
MKLGRWLLGFFIGVVLLAGCGESTDPGMAKNATGASARAELPPAPKCPGRSKQIRVMLDGHVGPENVGVLMAARRGYFGDAGLRVRVGSPAKPGQSAPSVAAGTADLGVTQQPQVLLERDEGVPLIGLGSVVSQPTEAMIWLRSSGIHRIADLKGKTIAIPGVPFQRSFLEKVLTHAGLGLDDVKLERVGYHLVPMLLSGKADAAFGGSWNLDGAVLRTHGEHPVIVKAQDLGIPGYDEAVLFAPYECVYEHSGLYRDFLAAVRRGTAAALKSPDGAARAIEENPESDPRVGRRALRAQLKATLPLLSRDQFLSPARGRLIEWMKREGLLSGELTFAIVFTNYYR